MAYVIVDGSGTYSVLGHTFSAGSTRCDDPDVLDAIQRDREVDWVYVQSDRSVERVEPPATQDEHVHTEEPYDTWQGRDGKWYFTTPVADGSTVKQSKPYDEEEIALAAAEMARDEAGKVPLAGTEDPNAPLSGELTKDELEATEFPCKEDGCTKVFQSSDARVNHERVQKHGVHKPDETADKAKAKGAKRAPKE